VSIAVSTIEDGIVVVTLNRPERLNALDQDHVTELLHVLDAHTAYGSARVVVLAGAGRAFCAVHGPAVDREDRTQVLASLTDDMAEAVAAFNERRPTRFTNR